VTDLQLLPELFIFLSLICTLSHLLSLDNYNEIENYD